MPIPSTKSTPQGDLGRLLTVLYGPPKIGKTTFAAGFPDACFLATEKGLEAQAVSRWEAADGRYVITSWEELLDATAEVIAAKGADGKTPRFRTMIIDTIGNACGLCEAYVCKKNGEEYKSDGKLGFGKGAAMIVGELKRYLTKLSSVGVGVVLVGHATTKEISSRTGELKKTVLFVPGDNKRDELYNAILGMADLVLYCEQQADVRVIRTKPHATYDAGERTGRLPDPIPATYAALLAAFNAPQKDASK